MGKHLEGPRAPAGWYPDPEDATRLRYWDGNTWAELPAPTAPLPPVATTPEPEPEPPKPIAETPGSGDANVALPPPPHLPPPPNLPAPPHLPPPPGPSRPKGPKRAKRTRQRALLIAFTAVIALFAGIVFGVARRSDDGSSSFTRRSTTTEYVSPSSDETTTPETTWDPGPSDPTEPTTPVGGSVEFNADRLVSMIGRLPTADEAIAISELCAQDVMYGMDYHCEDTAGFGFSFSNDEVREVYLYDINPATPDEGVQFAGVLPGGVSWDDTLADVTQGIGEPDCVDTDIGYNIHYTSANGNLDYTYTFESAGWDDSELYEITVMPLESRTQSCM
jgi:hypothetical protein